MTKVIWVVVLPENCCSDIFENNFGCTCTFFSTCIPRKEILLPLTLKMPLVPEQRLFIGSSMDLGMLSVQFVQVGCPTFREAYLVHQGKTT